MYCIVHSLYLPRYDPVVIICSFAWGVRRTFGHMHYDKMRSIIEGFSGNSWSYFLPFLAGFRLASRGSSKLFLPFLPI